MRAGRLELPPLSGPGPKRWCEPLDSWYPPDCLIERRHHADAGDLRTGDGIGVGEVETVNFVEFDRLQQQVGVTGLLTSSRL